MDIRMIIGGLLLAFTLCQGAEGPSRTKRAVLKGTAYSDAIRGGSGGESSEITGDCWKGSQCSNCQEPGVGSINDIPICCANCEASGLDFSPNTCTCLHNGNGKSLYISSASGLLADRRTVLLSFLYAFLVVFFLRNKC